MKVEGKMRKAKIFFIAGLIMLVASGGILFWHLKGKQIQPVKGQAAQLFTEQWIIEKFREMDVLVISGGINHVVATMPLGPQEWKIYGCLKNISPDQCNEFSRDYEINYVALDFKNRNSGNVLVTWRWGGETSFVQFANSPEQNDIDLVPTVWPSGGNNSTFSSNGYYNGAITVDPGMARGPYQYWGTSWPKKWYINGTIY